MVQGKVLAAETLGAVLGPTQVFLLRELVDSPMALAFVKAKAAGQSPTPPFLMAQLKGFGSPSVIISVVTGAVFEGLGAYGAYKSKHGFGGGILANEAVNAGFMTYGGSVLASAILSGIFPQQNWAAAVAVDPGNPIGAGSRVSRGQLNVGSPGGSNVPTANAFT